MIKKKIDLAEKRVKELVDSGDLKKLSPNEATYISEFYRLKGENRLETAKIIFEVSEQRKNYSDYGESVSAAYYAMYYIVHYFIASKYKTKLRAHIRGVHAVTNHLILFYLVKTNKLAKHLYEEYINTLDLVSEIQNWNVADFNKEAFDIAESYDKARSSREIFTYSVTKSAEKHHAERTIKIAEEFINTLKQLTIKN